MKVFSKVLSVLAAALCLFSLCGCDLFESNDELLSPPRPQGELYLVQKALSKVAPAEMQLKYPTAGQYRSAITSVDIDGNGKNEAVAFFMTESENITMMHLSVVYKSGDEWIATRDLSVVASGVERVQFDDLDGDGVSEIIVGWNVYTGVEKNLAVYSFKEGKLSHLLLEKYTEFITCDLDTDKQKELFLINLNQTDKTAKAHIFKYGENGIEQLSGCHSDGNVSGYASLTEQKLLGGRQAIIVDALKGSRMHTEVFYLENGALLNPLCDLATNQTLITERPVSAPCRDINGDGTLDIPIMSLMPGYEGAEEKDKLYFTRWCSFDGKNLNITTYSAMNYEDGYYFLIPKRLENKITVVKSASQKLRTVYLYDEAAKFHTEELFRIQTFAPDDWNADKAQNGWVKLFSDENRVIAANLSPNATEAITLEELTEMFKIIEG